MSESPENVKASPDTLALIEAKEVKSGDKIFVWHDQQSHEVEVLSANLSEAGVPTITAKFLSDPYPNQEIKCEFRGRNWNIT